MRCHRKLVGQSGLPRQEKEDRKDLEEGANVSDKANGYVENDEVEKLRISGFSQLKSKVCRERGGSKEGKKVMQRVGGKCKEEKTLKRDGKGLNISLEEVACVLPPRTQESSHVKPIGKRTENRPRATEAKEGHEGERKSAPAQA